MGYGHGTALLNTATKKKVSTLSNREVIEAAAGCASPNAPVEQQVASIANLLEMEGEGEHITTREIIRYLYEARRV